MEVIFIEHQAFKRLEQMFIQSQEKDMVPINSTSIFSIRLLLLVNSNIMVKSNIIYCYCTIKHLSLPSVNANTLSMHMSEFKEFIKISSGKHPQILKGQFRAIEFANEGMRISYIPSLNLSTYGNTKEEADEMMATALNDAIVALNSCEPSELLSQLKSYGWERNSLFQKELSNKAHIDNQGILREFDLAENTELEERLVTV